jgi:hypothetical protein
MAQNIWDAFFIFRVLVQNCLVTLKWELLEWFVCHLIKGCLNVVLRKHQIISKIKKFIFIKQKGFYKIDMDKMFWIVLRSQL